MTHENVRISPRQKTKKIVLSPGDQWHHNQREPPAPPNVAAKSPDLSFASRLVRLTIFEEVVFVRLIRHRWRLTRRSSCPSIFMPAIAFCYMVSAMIWTIWGAAAWPPVSFGGWLKTPDCVLKYWRECAERIALLSTIAIVLGTAIAILLLVPSLLLFLTRDRTSNRVRGSD